MRRLTEYISNLTNRGVLLILVASAALTGCLSVVVDATATEAGEWWVSALQNFSTEMLGAFLTFVLIDVVIGGREKLRRRLRKRLRSPNREITASAANELRSRGWLQDGSLQGAYLSHSNLRGVDLSGGDLQGARLTSAKINNTNLSDADLEGTTLKVEQLAKAYSLRGAAMPDGRRYDGRLNLQGDLQAARGSGVDVGNADEMADFYGVSVDQYVHGQEWARDALPDLRRDGKERVAEHHWWQK